MEKTDGDTASKSKGAQDDSGSSHDRERLTGSIAVKAFSCLVCTKPLRPPIFQCSVGHFFCSSCHDKLPGNKCQLCSGCALECSHGMERAVRSILVDCCYAEQGCTEKTTYYGKGDHEAECPHALCFCPEPGCSFAGSREELLDHLTCVHKWPSTTFQYQAPFDLRVIQPGSQVLRCMTDGQFFLVSVRQAAAPPGLTVSLVCVPPYPKPTGFGCTVSFSCFSRHRSTWTVDDLRPLRLSDWPPAEYVCVVPKPRVLDVADGDGAVLTITIVCGEDDDDEEYGYEDEDYLDDDISDTESDEDDSDS